MWNATSLQTALLLSLVVLLAAPSAQGETNSNAHEKSRSEATNLVASLWSGREVVFTLDPLRLKEEGLKAKQLKFVSGHRFREGTYRIRVGGKEVDLASLASVKVRNLYAPPFEVVLPDGRKALVTPKAKRIAEYLVTGEYFERYVRGILCDPFTTDTAEATVLSGIPVPDGQIPNAWGEDRVHISLGEPLKTFAEIRICGKPGPQAKDLERMRTVRRWLEEGLQLAYGTSRKSFEKAFGEGSPVQHHPDPHFKTIASWKYSLKKGSLQVWFKDGTGVVNGLNFWSGCTEPKGTEKNISELARALADAERETLLVFLRNLYGPSGIAVSEDVQRLLNRSSTDLEWTAEERRTLFRKSARNP